MKNVQGAKVFIAIMVTTAFIFSFSHFGAKAYENLFLSSNGYEDGTSIAGVDISGMSFDEALQAIGDAQGEWLKSTTISLKYKEKTVGFDTSLFVFRFQDSLQSVSTGTKNGLTVSLNQDELRSILNSISSDLVQEGAFYLTKWNDSLLAIASQLEHGNHEIDLQNFVVNNMEEEVILSDTTLDVKEDKDNVANWVQHFPLIEVGKEQTFSMLDILGEQEGIYADTTLSMVATALHQAVLSTNFTIAERFTSNELPAFATLGYEARINQSKKMDYRFYNPNDTAYKIQFKMVEDKLYVSITGVPFIYQYNVELSDKESFKPKTVLQFDALLGFNEYKLISNGADGLLIKVYRNALDTEGATVKKELISEDFYPPVYRVFATGLVEEDETIIDSDTVEDTESTENNTDSETENSGERNADSGTSENTTNSSNSTTNSTNTKVETNPSSNTNMQK